MKNKLAASSPKSASIRRSSPAAAAAAAAAAIATIITIVLADAMFCSKLAVAQQVAYKASRGPRIYNALITTDQRLLPSQADPIVTPVFRPFPFFYNGWPDVYAAAAATPVSARVVQQPATGAVAADAFEAAADARVDDDKGVSPPPPSAIKNNKPADTSVPDVPPPPLPVSRAGSAGDKDKKKPEEFPPAPLGFAF